MYNMKTRNRRKIIVTIAVNLVMLVAVIFLMNFVKKLLYSDVQINLTEVVLQNRDVITSRLNVELNNLQFAATQIGNELQQESDSNMQDFQNVVIKYSKENSKSNIYVSNKEGLAFFNDGQSLDVAGRRYFRLALEGKQNISDKVVSRATGSEIFVISVPLYKEGSIVGTVHKPYTLEEMYTLCSVSLFSAQGTMSIVNSEGYILVSSQSETGYSQESDNYFRNLFAQGNEKESRQLEKDIKDNRAGFMEVATKDKKIFSAYTSIPDIYDWYLISSIDTNAVSPNANMVIRMFYFILSMIVLVIGLSLFSFFSYKNRQQANLERIAFEDPITGGGTYNKFLLDLKRKLEENKQGQYYLLAFDIDNFKYLNSFYGFEFGDKILRRIYWEVRGGLSQDELLARISGDHFIALLEDAQEGRLKTVLRQTITENGVGIYISAGLYEIADREENISLMVDKATSTARQGKGQLQRKVVTYSEENNRTMMHDEQLKRQMEYALEAEEIIPFYQPKVNINTKQLVGAEALARWIKADGVMISPGRFIPLCEMTGQIVEVDFAIYEQVLKFLAVTLEQGVECVPISVNFSRVHLLGEDFVHKFMGKLRAYNVPPQLIQIELTESIFLGNTSMLKNFANQMHEYGVVICIDDFGSGYSSLNMLKDIPIDVLKIDKGFLDDTGNKKRQCIVLSSVAGMAEQLEMEVVVEGVETEENVALMKEFGCTVAQGYYFAKPMKEECFATIMREKHVK